MGVEPDDLSVDSAAATPLAHSPVISMRPAGFEPATSRLSTVRYCRLSYRRKHELGCEDSNLDR